MNNTPLHPAHALRKLIEKHEMTQQEVALRISMSEKHLSEILNEKKSITPETALKLEQVFGGKASFWINLQSRYDEDLARNHMNITIEDQVPFLDKFKDAYKDLVSLGYCKKTNDKKTKVSELLNFFNLTSLSSVKPVSEVAFRKSSKYAISDECLAAWLRVGEKKASEFIVKPYDKEKLQSSLVRIRNITQDIHSFEKNLLDITVECGVKLVFVTHFTHVPVSGVARWIDGTPMIQLSDMGKQYAKIIFTLFHELGHVLLHQGESFMDEKVGIANSDKKEQEADNFAQNAVIPPEFGFEDKIDLLSSNQAEVIKFSKEVGVSPSVVVGRIQKTLNKYTIHHNLLTKIKITQ